MNIQPNNIIYKCQKLISLKLTVRATVVALKLQISFCHMTHDKTKVNALMCASEMVFKFTSFMLVETRVGIIYFACCPHSEISSDAAGFGPCFLSPSVPPLASSWRIPCVCSDKKTVRRQLNCRAQLYNGLHVESYMELQCSFVK